jgi:hypothetical protein
MLKFIILFLILFLNYSCSDVSTKTDRLDPDVVKYPDPRERAYRKRMGDNETFLGNLFGKKSENKNLNIAFNVNPFIWKASIEVLSKTIPLSSVDSASGIIISDWYNLKGKSSERIKVSVSINTRELRADGLNVSVFKQTNRGNSWVNVEVDPKIALKIERKIMFKAGQLSAETN